MFLAECHLLHMIMLLLFKQKSICLYHLVVKQTLNSALQRAFEALQQCLLDDKGINFDLIHRRNNAVTVDDKVKFKKNQFSKQTGYTSNISISYDG